MASDPPPNPSNPSSPVESFRNASDCSSQWDKMSGTEQFRICGLCNRTVYDFTNMDPAKARALVYKRESKENPVFYRRSDGRFLTSDCPVALRKTWTKFSGISAAMALLIAVLVLPNLIVLAPEDTSHELSKTPSSSGQKPQTQFPLLASTKPGSGKPLTQFLAFQPAASIRAQMAIPSWLEVRPRGLGQNFGSTHESLPMNQLTTAALPVLPDWLKARNVENNATSMNAFVQDSSTAPQAETPESSALQSNSTSQPANGSSGNVSDGGKLDQTTTDSSTIETPNQAPRMNDGSEKKNDPYVKNY